MNKRELARFKNLIEEERTRVLNELGTIEKGISDRQAGQKSGNQSYSNHMADVGSDAMDQEQAYVHASRESDYLRLLDDALKRVEVGTYGVCEDCGGRIPVKRLEAYLAARLCIDCKSKQEKLQRS